MKQTPSAGHREMLTNTFYMYSARWECICHVTIAPAKSWETASTRDGYTWSLRAHCFHFQSTVNMQCSAEQQKLPASHRSWIFQLLEKRENTWWILLIINHSIKFNCTDWKLHFITSVWCRRVTLQFIHIQIFYVGHLHKSQDPIVLT